MYNNYINDRDILVDLESKVLLWLSWITRFHRCELLCMLLRIK